MSGSLVLSHPGQVLDAVLLTGCIAVTAPHVTIQRSLIRASGCVSVVTVEPGGSVVIADVEIDGQNQGPDYSAVYPEGYTCVRCNIHNYGDAFAIDYSLDGTPGLPVLIQDSWLHDLSYSSTSHTQDILSNGSTAGATIRHNRIDNQLTQTAAISLFGDFQPVQNITVEGNLLNGGGFEVYPGCDPGKPYGMQCQNIAFTNNRFMRAPSPGGFFAAGGYWGPFWTYVHTDPAVPFSPDPGFVAAHHLRWSGNVWDDTGAPVA